MTDAHDLDARAPLDDDEFRAYIEDASVLLDDGEVRVVWEPDQMAQKARYRATQQKMIGGKEWES